jgi:hypothetical protein
MIVHEPRIEEAGDEVVVSAELEVERSDAASPSRLYFALPRRWRDAVDTRADAFAAALLPLAMSRGERLEVRGELSLRLMGGLREYQRIQGVWKPEMFSPVEIRCDRLVRRELLPAPTAVAASFSGGVDSFYTLWRHLGENEPIAPFRLTHCIMINGFDGDASPDDPAAFARLPRVYEPFLAAHGIRLILVRTNLLHLLGPFVRQQSYASFVIATALLLGRLLSRFYLPAGFRVTTMGLLKDGSHLMLDHLLATESLETVHDSADVTRVEKTLTLAHWPETYDRLRVCHRATRPADGGDAIANCCICDKCIRTMVPLAVAGVLSRYRCFPWGLDRKRIRAVDLRLPSSRPFAREIIAHAESAGRRDVARDVRRALWRSRNVWPPLCAAVAASYRLERRWPAFGRLLAPLKQGLKRIGWGRGIFY